MGAAGSTVLIAAGVSSGAGCWMGFLGGRVIAIDAGGGGDFFTTGGVGTVFSGNSIIGVSGIGAFGTGGLGDGLDFGASLSVATSRFIGGCVRMVGLEEGGIARKGGCSKLLITGWLVS